MKEITSLEIRHLLVSDYEELLASMKLAYTGMDSVWSLDNIKRLLSKFPDGQIVALADNVIVGCALSIRINDDDFEEDHTYQEITGNYTFDTHNQFGDMLYGIDVFIRPDYRGLRLGRRLYDARKELCEELNLKGIVFGGRMPNYKEHSNELKPKEYIEKVKKKEIYDPVLTFQLSNDFHVIKVLTGYLPGDTESKDYACLMEWNNIYYRSSCKLINVDKTVIRLGLIQWQMRPLSFRFCIVSRVF